MMKKWILCFALLSTTLLAQQHTRVYFNDKGTSINLLSNPYHFLSPKAIENKALRGVAIGPTDVPVSREYKGRLQQLGLEIEMTSRWFNYALVSGDVDVAQVSALPFVKKIETAERYQVQYAERPEKTASAQLAYGIARGQIEMIEGEFLHGLDYTGQGMTIAVIDGGYTGADTQVGLDSLWARGQVQGTYNFIDKDTSIFKDGSHGTKVLTILAGYIDSAYVGSAIDANYWLLKSENESSEKPIEMDYWLAAAEYADSVGADVITSSLGYNIFDGGVGNLEKKDLDGNTALVTRAADMAASKGLLVVVSAGNEGTDSWGLITAPADGDSVLTVGGVDWYGSYAAFSSRGPTADGRIKPDVVAVAQNTAYISSAGPTYGSGTSFSCPIISGMAACLWQAYPGLSNMQIFEAIRSSASQRYTPDFSMGFGIPNFRIASWSIGIDEPKSLDTAWKVYPNPVGNAFTVKSDFFEEGSQVALFIIDVKGNLLHEETLTPSEGKLVINTAQLQAGSYVVGIKIGEQVYLHKIIK